MKLNARARQVLDIFHRFRDEWVSLNLADSVYRNISYTFRNGVSDLRSAGYEIIYSAKFRAYKLLREPFQFDDMGQGRFV